MDTVKSLEFYKKSSEKIDNSTNYKELLNFLSSKNGGLRRYKITIKVEEDKFNGGCNQCGSGDITEISNNHHQTEDESEYLEFMKCNQCGYEFVD